MVTALRPRVGVRTLCVGDFGTPIFFYERGQTGFSLSKIAAAAFTAAANAYSAFTTCVLAIC